MIRYHNDKNKKWEYELIYRNQKDGITDIWGYDEYQSAEAHKKLLRSLQPEIDYPHIVIIIERTKDFERKNNGN